jgi:hypothetical protein
LPTNPDTAQTEVLDTEAPLKRPSRIPLAKIDSLANEEGSNHDLKVLEGGNEEQPIEKKLSKRSLTDIRSNGKMNNDAIGPVGGVDMANIRLRRNTQKNT